MSQDNERGWASMNGECTMPDPEFGLYPTHIWESLKALDQLNNTCKAMNQEDCSGTSKQTDWKRE